MYYMLLRKLIGLPSPMQRVLSTPLYSRFLMNALKYCLKISPIELHNDSKTYSERKKNIEN